MDNNQSTPTLLLLSINHALSHLKTRIIVLFCLAVVLLSVPFTQAAEVPDFDKAVIINAREQPVDQFLTELFGQLGVPARVSDSISGSVNGDFRKNARDVFHDIASSFQLSVYYDGAVAHIYPSKDIIHNILYMPKSKASDIERVASKMGMVDPYNSLSVAEVGLVVTGAPRFFDQVEQMTEAMGKKVNASTPPRAPVVTHDTYRTFQLRYAWADDVSLVIGGETVVVPGVASIIRSLIEPGALHNPQLSGYRIPDSPTLEGLRGKGLQSVNGQTESPVASNSLTLPGAASSGNRDDGSTANTRIVADALSNSVIIRDKANRMKEYEQLIESLDKEPQMIEIEATIIDLDTDKLRELGINWRLQRGDGEALLGDGTFADELLRPNTDVTPSGNGGFVSLVLGSQQQFISRIRALESQGAARIVSKPHVMTLSNVEALLDTTSTFFVRVEGQEEVDLFDVSVGTTLRVTPHVYENGGRSQIKLRVNIEDGSTSDQRVDSIPVVENSTIATQAIIDVGQSLLIGGLVRETKANGTSRVPYLGRIPVLGSLFRSNTKTSTRNERMFLITPRVTNSRIAGKRFSAPILSGSEAEIIQSAPSRLNNTQQALNLRDETFPLENSLPRGDGLQTNDRVNVEPLSANQSSGDAQSTPDSGTAPPQPRSLRDRLYAPKLQPQGLKPTQQNAALSTPQTGAPAVATATDFMHEPNDGWQVITVAPAITSNRRESLQGGAADVSATDTPSTADNVRQSPSSLPVDDDGWQVVN